MANEDLRVRITAQIQGLDAVESLKNAVRQLQTTAAPAAADLQKLKNAAMQLGSATDRTENDLRRSINALKDVRSQLAVTGTEYKKLTKTINEYQQALDKATGAQRGGGGSRTGQAIGAIASGAIFGGVEGGLGGLLGAGLGAATGGGAVAGAFAGAAVGATAGIFRQQITGASDYAGELARLRIALKGVSTDQAEFNKSLNFIEKTAPQFLMSVGDATKNYTKLQASVRGAGMGVDETQKVFQGLSAAIVATGGGTEQLNGAMLAATQVFSKGKVSAEELRGQIGERLPGAFTLFAQAVKMTPQQLDKALEQGKISTADFVKFAEELYKRYGESAKAIGDSPFASSVRFQIAMDNMRAAAGNALLPIISFFQNLGTEALNSLTRVFEGTTQWQQALGGAFSAIGKLIGGVEGLNKILGGLIKTMIVLGGVQAGLFVVSNLTAFSNGIKSIIGLTRTFLELSKSLLKIETARAAINAILTGVTTGASRGKIAGAIIGGGAGLVAVAGLGKAVDSLINGLTSSIEKATKMPELGGNFGGQVQPVPQSTGTDANSEKARREAEKLAAEQQRLDEQVARARIQVDNAIFKNSLELIRKRYDYEQERIRQQRDIWAGTFEGVRSESARSFVGLLNQLDDLRKRTRDAALGMIEAQQGAQSAQRMESVTSQGLGTSRITSGIIARTGNTGQSTGAHLDARWADGRRITAADADRYLMVNGRAPSSFGVTSPYGPRSLFGRSFHNGIDFGTPAGSGITLRNGASLLRDLGFTGAGGYAVEIMTPQGPMRLLHLQGGSAARATGVAAQTRRDVRAEGNVGVAQADLAQARELLGLERNQVQSLERNIPQLYAQQQTQGLRDQAKALEDNNALLVRRIELEAQGVRPELIEAQMKIAEIEVQRTDRLAQLNENLAEAQRLNDPTAAAAVRAEIEATNSAYDRQITAISTLAQVQTASGAALGAYIGRLKQELEQLTNFEQIAIRIGSSIESSLSTAISSAVSGFATGSANIRQTLSQLFADIGKSFIDMAAQIIAKQLVMVALNSILGIFSGGGGGGGGLASAFTGKFDLSGTSFATMPKTFGFATGGVMTNVGPLPLKRYAGGGVANSPQVAMYGERGPEAYVPLPDGRSIPVKMRGDARSSALSRYQPVPGGVEAAMAGGETMSASGGGGGGGMIDVRYTVERINNVEYVTAEQFQQGLRQAAAEGAARGEQRTLRRLQTSVSTRKRIGV